MRKLSTLSRVGILVSAVVAIGIVVLGVANVPTRGGIWCLRNDAAIENHIQGELPLGSSKQNVLEWLSRNHASSDGPKDGVFKPGTSYPLSRSGGSSFIQAVVGTYGWPFEVDVEVFFIFDQGARLSEVRVRKTVAAI